MFHIIVHFIVQHQFADSMMRVPVTHQTWAAAGAQARATSVTDPTDAHWQPGPRAGLAGPGLARAGSRARAAAARAAADDRHRDGDSDRGRGSGSRRTRPAPAGAACPAGSAGVTVTPPAGGHVSGGGRDPAPGGVTPAA